MSYSQKVSIIINNYNYGRFLKEAIDSALNQTYPNTEVIVVDDGSTDNSREIIADYGNRIILVLKENEGQASAFNAGFNRASGDVIIFLDSDDILIPTAAGKALRCFQKGGISKVHWTLLEINKNGEKTGAIIPNQALPQGDLSELLILDGPDSDLSQPTSGNAWARSFLEKVFPLPEVEFRAAADAYLMPLAAIYGSIESILEPQGYYRIHGKNDSRKSLEERLKLFFWRFDYRCHVLSKHLQNMGINSNPDLWKQRNAHYIWMKQIHTAIQEIVSLVPEHESLIFVDQNDWMCASSLHDRRLISFLEKDGQYWGAPDDDRTAINELERLRQDGASFIVFTWAAFWWLDYYTEFNCYLRSNFNCLLENARLVVFDLQRDY